MSEMLMAILLVYSTSGNTSDKKVCRDFKMAAIMKIWKTKHSFILNSDMKRSSLILLKKVYFNVTTSSMSSQCGLKVGYRYSFVYVL